MFRQTRPASRKGRGVGRTRWWWAALLLLGASPPQGMEITPPQPDPTNPINYIAWINQTFENELEDNAFQDYQAAFNRLQPFQGRWQGVVRNPWVEDPQVSAWLRANREGLDLFRQATRKRECFYHHTPPEPIGDPRIDECLLGVSAPWASKYRDATIGLMAEGYQLAKAGKYSALTDNALTVLRAAHHYYGGPMLRIRMAATRSASRAYKGIRHALDRSNDPGALAATMAKRLGAIDPSLPPLRFNARMERVASWDFCQRLFVPGEPNLYEPLCQAISKKRGRDLNAVERMIINRAGFDGTLREIDVYFDLLEHWLDRPYHLTPPGKREQERRKKFEYIPAETKNPVLKFILPSFSVACDLNVRLTATRRATHLIIHLHDHGRRHGGFPERLDQLEAANLAELRVDPFSGRDFVYRKERRGFKLYTVSSNMKDDGGKHQAKGLDRGDYVFWPVPD